MLTLIEHPVGQAFLMAQMSAKKGLQTFGEAGASAVVEELRQLEYRNVLEPIKSTQLTRSDRIKALRYLMYLKRKRCGRIKARGCADGRKQRIYKTKDETSSPTVSIEALFLTSVIDAHERRNCRHPRRFHARGHGRDRPHENRWANGRAPMQG